MSTQPVYAFFHEPSGTLVRAHTRAGCEVSRRGEQLAMLRAHSNTQVSFTPAGHMMITDSCSAHWRYDLGGPWPQKGTRLPSRPVVLHPDGVHALATGTNEYPYTDPVAGAPHAGLMVVVAATGSVVDAWLQEPLAPRQIQPFDQTRNPASDRGSSMHRPNLHQDLLWSCREVVLAEDGRTWAVVGTNRVMLGRAAVQTADVFWEHWGFYPQNATFDLGTERVILAGRPGILALDLHGEPVASWWGGAAVHGPVLIRGDEVLAVIDVPVERARAGVPRWQQVARFDRRTLAFEGPLTGMPRRRLDEPASALLATRGGSILWVPQNEPIFAVVSPADEASDSVGSLAAHAPKDRLPAPSAGWYDTEVGAVGTLHHLGSASSGQLRSLARHLLEHLSPDPRFEELILLDQGRNDAFAPWRDAVLAFDARRLGRLQRMDPQRCWWISNGASDGAVDDLCEKIEKRPDRSAAGSELRVCLLAGVLTPRALERLGDLGRAVPWIAEVARSCLVEIPHKGRAIARFVPAFEDLLVCSASKVEPDPTLRAGPDHDVRGSDCHKPLVRLLSVDLSGFGPLRSSPMGVQPFFVGDCSRCGSTGGPKTAVFDAAGPRGLPPDEHACGGEPAGRATRLVLVRARYDPGPWRLVGGRLGGRPHRQLGSEVPGCPDCGRLMFHVGFVKRRALYPTGADVELWGFHCEECGVAVQVSQPC